MFCDYVSNDYLCIKWLRCVYGSNFMLVKSRVVTIGIWDIIDFVH